MDDGGHRENGRHKPPQQGQWLVQNQPSMKQIMSIMAERDAAIQERNLAISEKKAALAERDMAVLQRDTAVAERNAAVAERDNAIATLQFRENPSGHCPPGCQISRTIKHVHQPLAAADGGGGDTDALPASPPAKPRQTKRAKSVDKNAPRGSKKVKTERGFDEPHDGNGSNRNQIGSKPDWKDQDLGLNQVAFDESTMPIPVCSCTGVFRPCYKWGNGGWQSSCCTTTMSMHPLPSLPNKRHARVGGRKMSGSAFNKLISRLAAEGYDLSNPVDLKDHWAKHGTNRYITIK